MWKPSTKHKYGVAVFNFHEWSNDLQGGLYLNVGDLVHILEYCEGWYRGFCNKNRSHVGLFPASYIHLKQFRIESDGAQDVVLPVEDPVVQEASAVLKEWGHLWKEMYIKLASYNEAGSVLQGKFAEIKQAMLDIMIWRKELLTVTLTSDQIGQLHQKITTKIDWGNKKLGLDLVPRVSGAMVDVDTVGAVELYQIHLDSSKHPEVQRVSEVPMSSSFSRRSSSRSLGSSTLTLSVAKPSPNVKSKTHHLFFCMRDVSYHIGEDCELFISLFDAARQRFISERFRVKLPKEGFANYIDRVHSNCTIFTDLGVKEFSGDLHLVVHVVRVGRMLTSESSKKAPYQSYRRPHAVAAFKLDLEGLRDGDSEVEITSKLYSNADEKDMWQLHEFVIKKLSNKYSALSASASCAMVVSVRVLAGDLDTAIKEHSLLLKNVRPTSKIGFSDVIMPGDVRNDLYVTLSHGEFERAGKSVGKNIEVTVIALDYCGVHIPCISAGTGSDLCSEFNSTILYHNNSPRWTEPIKVAIPIDKFSSAHLRFEFRHCSTREKNEKKLFGFSFVRLMETEGGTTLRDSYHELCVYKCEDRSRLANPPDYLCSPYLTKYAAECVYNLPFQRSMKEFFVIETQLCSTKLTQNVDLLSLLRWKSEPDGIGETLSRLVKVDGSEIVKFLQDVLDALFSMFSTEEGNSTQHSGHVFQALATIFSMLESSKFEHFKPVMDAYITGHFAAALVHKGLVSCVKHLSDLCPQTEKQEPIVRCFRSLHYIFKFAIQSRLLFVRATGGSNEDSFRADINNLMESFERLLLVQRENILPSQEALLESIQGGCEQLCRLLPAGEVARLLCHLLSTSPLSTTSDHLTKARLHAFSNACSKSLCDDPEGRRVIVVSVCEQLRAHLLAKVELKLCSQILSKIITLVTLPKTNSDSDQELVSVTPSSLDEDIETLVLGLIDVVIETILSVPQTSTTYGLLVACLLGLLQSMSETHYLKLWELHHLHGAATSSQQLHHLIFNFIVLLSTLVAQSRPVFPKDWFLMHTVSNGIVMNAMQEIAKPILQHFTTGSKFDYQLWSSYLLLGVEFLTQPSLQLERFSPQKRYKLIHRYSDMRVLMGFQILSMWHQLADEQRVQFVSSLVGPFLEMTLVPEPELRKATLPIFFDMMQAEQIARGNFKQVETELIDKLDILVSENKGDDEYRQLFNTMLLEKVRSNDPTWRDSGAAFVQSVTRLLERLLDYRSVMQGHDNSDKRISCTVNLLNFYKNEINRQEMYIRYIYKLHDLHLPAGNFTEAGFTLQLHANQLLWSSRVLHADLVYPAQTEMSRKEYIYHRIVDYFDKGKSWEEGIPLLEELATIYKTRLFDYQRLAEVLKLQATFYQKILTGKRYSNEYFRVGFYGIGLPLFVRNKAFIYRGLEYEQIGAFTERIQSEFPQAKLLSHNLPPDEVAKTSMCQLIQICAVKPVPEIKPEFEGVEVDERILHYYTNNHVTKFVYNRPNTRGQQDKDNEFKNLWVERITYNINSPLPGILKWFEVCDQSVEQICPPQYACETVEKRAHEIKNTVNHYRANPKDNIQPFTMLMNGAIDAGVNGGIAMYLKAFFTPDYITQHPEQAEYVVSLKQTLIELTTLLETALDLHGKIAPDSTQPLHKRLIKVFENLRSEVMRKCAPTSQTTPQNSKRSTPSIHSFSSISSSGSTQSNTSHLHTHHSTPTSSIPTHRRADSDPASEFRRTGSIINSPLPPVPSNTLGSHHKYNTNHHDYIDDGVYSRPNYEFCDVDSISISSIGSRPRSVVVTDSSRGGSPNRHLTRSTNSSEFKQRDSHSSHESLPPLPPRGSTGDRNSSRSISFGGGGEDTPPPVLPKRGQHQRKSYNQSGHFSTSYSEADFMSFSPSLDLSHTNGGGGARPPPIPPKQLSSTPLTPRTPSSEDLTPHANVDVDAFLAGATLGGFSNERHVTTVDVPDYNGGEDHENYSVPPRLRQPYPHL